MLKNLSFAMEQLHKKRPLIHCIPSIVAINDCANAVLAVGAQPIMAEHPQEVSGITASAGALTVSMANITDARLRSIHICGETAFHSGIPSIIDLVGITCSPLRMDHARTFIADAHPTVVKGNYSEIRAIAGDTVSTASGVDMSEEDIIHSEEDLRLAEMQRLVHSYAAEHHAVVMATGAIDLVSDGVHDLKIAKGHPLMSRVTGTGCILTCITGAYLSVCSPLEACLYALLHWDISGEKAAEFTKNHQLGLGSYHIALMDALSRLTAETILSESEFSYQ